MKRKNCHQILSLLGHVQAGTLIYVETLSEGLARFVPRPESGATDWWLLMAAPDDYGCPRRLSLVEHLEKVVNGLTRMERHGNC